MPRRHSNSSLALTPRCMKPKLRTRTVFVSPPTLRRRVSRWSQISLPSRVTLKTSLQSRTRRLSTKSTHGSEWIINFNLSPRLHKRIESHQRELVDRSFKPERGRNGKIHELTLMVFPEEVIAM